MTDDRRKSDIAVVPEKSRNAVDASTGDATEGRAVAKGNSPERNVLRTQGRASTPSALERVRQAAQRDKKQRFTTLLHGLPRADARGRRGCGRRDVALVRADAGGQPPRFVRPGAPVVLSSDRSRTPPHFY